MTASRVSTEFGSEDKGLGAMHRSGDKRRDSEEGGMNEDKEG